MEIGDSNTRQQGFYVVCMVAKTIFVVSLEVTENNSMQILL